MIINHNISALTAYNKSNAAGKAKANAMEKLSSGLRINSAADDAAGSAIDQKMKAQIRGLEQASRNIQDGVSLVQTAEAGLGSIQNPNLLRMRDLIIQSLNGTLTGAERMNIQNELESVKASINDIANNTEFNKIKVLSPPSNETQLKSSEGKVDIVFVVDNTGSMSTIQNKVATNITNFINYINSQGVSDIRMGVVEYTDSTINKFQFSGNKWTNSSSDISSALSHLVNSGGIENAMTALSEVADDYDFRENESVAQTKNIILITDEDADDDTTTMVTSTMKKLKDQGIRLYGVYNTNDHSSYTPGIDNTDVKEFDDIVEATGGKKIDVKSPNWGDELASIIGAQIGSSGSVVEQDDDMPTLQLQVGANSGDRFEVKLFDARTENLGIDDVSVETIEAGKDSLDKIDKAIRTVSSERGKFGSYQNALEHIYSNVGNYGYSLTSADSRISDVDMAKAVMEMTKSSIIQESAQAMLKQADQMQKSVLNLMTKWQGSAQ
ncbi:VWA domain-containing protein [Clostridium estertheticum]|uniref:flagellin n=1 Tax=Clostridium estertheticum TaxID=238834 RepID=UPI001C6EE523|nr:flagellin [Clostridium estertheticum]MBW9170646.1 VWA domain-containing protein [Clostridium estertheticum]WLC74507.1 VWA domain-containing protein [Clostridium estertheticum]